MPSDSEQPTSRSGPPPARSGPRNGRGAGAVAWLARIGAPLDHRAWHSPLRGAIVVLGVIGAVTAVLFVLGWVELDPTSDALDALLRSTAFAPLVVVRVVAEELVFRGAIQSRATTMLSGWLAVVAQAALFGLWGSLLAGTPDVFVGVAVIGAFLGAIRLVTGTVWAGVGVALGIAAGEQLLGALGMQAVGGMEAATEMSLNASFLIVFLLLRTTAASWTIHDWVPDLPPGGSRRDGDGEAAPGLRERGVMYDVGVSYQPGQSSRTTWNAEVVRGELQVIHDDLHADAVLLIGTEVQRLEAGARMALEVGLDVWIQPRLVDASTDELLAQLREVAVAAEGLRRDFPSRVRLNVGCELSVFTSGIIPGEDFGQRANRLEYGYAAMPWVSWRLNRLLARAVDVAREEFVGPLSYGAGSWERVDWDPFDVVGLDHYLDDSTRTNYVATLRRHRRHRKPIVVFEFGCCAYQGAERAGGGGGWIQDWDDLDDRRLDDDYVRDEQVQATYLAKVIDVLEAEDVDGAYVCMFIEGDHPTSDDPRRDLDMASLGIVKAYPTDADLPADDGHWEPKLAFHELARRYATSRSRT